VRLVRLVRLRDDFFAMWGVKLFFGGLAISLVGRSPLEWGDMPLPFLGKLTSRGPSRLDQSKVEAWLPDSKAPAAQETASQRLGEDLTF